MKNLNLLRRNTKQKSKMQEKKIAKQIGGKTTIASGALDIQKADVRTDEFLIEAKTTKNDFYILKYSTWSKVYKEALRDGMRTPIMQITLQDDSESIELAVMSYLDFIGYDFYQEVQFLYRYEPHLTDKMSYKITGDFIEEAKLHLEDLDVDCSKVKYYYREDVKLVRYDLHLVIIEWSTFLEMCKHHNIIP